MATITASSFHGTSAGVLANRPPAGTVPIGTHYQIVDAADPLNHTIYENSVDPTGAHTWLTVGDTSGATVPAYDLYVAVGGDDSNSGTALSPLATIYKALELLQPGWLGTKAVHVGAGTFDQGTGGLWVIPSPLGGPNQAGSPLRIVGTFATQYTGSVTAWTDAVGAPPAYAILQDNALGAVANQYRGMWVRFTSGVMTDERVQIAGNDATHLFLTDAFGGIVPAVGYVIEDTATEITWTTLEVLTIKPDTFAVLEGIQFTHNSNSVSYEGGDLAMLSCRILTGLGSQWILISGNLSLGLDLGLTGNEFTAAGVCGCHLKGPTGHVDMINSIQPSSLYAYLCVLEDFRLYCASPNSGSYTLGGPFGAVGQVYFSFAVDHFIYGGIFEDGGVAGGAVALIDIQGQVNCIHGNNKFTNCEAMLVRCRNGVYLTIDGLTGTGNQPAGTAGIVNALTSSRIEVTNATATNDRAGHAGEDVNISSVLSSWATNATGTTANCTDLLGGFSRITRCGPP